MRLKDFDNSSEQGFTRLTSINDGASFNEWSARFKDRQERMTQPEKDFSFSFPSNVLINLISDLHVGHPTTNYKRIEDEVNEITVTPNSYVILAGDEINNMNWNPGQMQEMEQTPEQVAYIRALIKHFVQHNKLLHHIQGDHDGWLSKGGLDIPSELPGMGVSVSNGPTYFHMGVGQEKYELAGAHQLPGHSIYNTNHPQMRAVRFGSMHGADVVFSGHNHKKGVSVAYQHELGQPQETTYIALGPYKSTDEWLSKKGWPAQQPAEMFGVSVYLGAVEREIQAVLDIVEANKMMQNGN